MMLPATMFKTFKPPYNWLRCNALFILMSDSLHGIGCESLSLILSAQ